MTRKRVRVRARGRPGRPKEDIECLEEARKKGKMSGFELLKFLYDCLKGKR